MTTLNNQEYYFNKLASYVNAYYLPNEIEFIRNIFYTNIFYTPNTTSTLKYREYLPQIHGICASKKGFGEIILAIDEECSIYYTIMAGLTYLIPKHTNKLTFCIIGKINKKILDQIISNFPNLTISDGVVDILINIESGEIQHKPKLGAILKWTPIGSYPDGKLYMTTRQLQSTAYIFTTCPDNTKQYDNMKDYCFEYELYRIWGTYDAPGHIQFDKCLDCHVESTITAEYNKKYGQNIKCKLLNPKISNFHGINKNKSSAQKVYEAIEKFCKVGIIEINNKTDNNIHDDFYNQPPITKFLDIPPKIEDNLKDYLSTFYNTDELKFIQSLDASTILPYRPNSDRKINMCGKQQNIHKMMILDDGYRKHFFNKLNCITKVLTRAPTTCIIASAIPNFYLPILKLLFPNITWHIYYSLMSPKYELFMTEHPDVKFYLKNISPEDAIEWKNKCDIFIGDFTYANHLSIKKKIIETMRPKAAIISFQIDEDIEYFDGELCTQVRGRAFSRECRLIITDFQLKLYSAKHIEDAMYTHNIRRVWETIDMDNKYCAIQGFDRCLDCATEIEIIGAYINKFGGQYTDIEIMNMLGDLQSIYKQKKYDLPTSQGYCFHGLYADLPAPQRIAKCVELFCKSDIDIYE